LRLASQKNKLDVIKLLINFGARNNLPKCVKSNLYNRMRNLKYIGNNVSDLVDSGDVEHSYILKNAVKCNQFEIVKLLLENGTNINCGKNSVMYYSAKNETMTTYLIDNGADISINNWRIMKKALYNCNSDVFQLCLICGIDIQIIKNFVNEQSNYNEWTNHIIIMAPDIFSVFFKLLYDVGIDLSCKNFINLAILYDDIVSIKLLIEWYPEILNNYDKLLITTIKQSNIAILKQLLSYGQKLHNNKIYIDTFILCLRKHNYHMTKLLINAGFNYLEYEDIIKTELIQLTKYANSKQKPFNDTITVDLDNIYNLMFSEKLN